MYCQELLDVPAICIDGGSGNPWNGYEHYGEKPFFYTVGARAVLALTGWATGFSVVLAQFAMECTLKLLADSGSCASILAFFADIWNSFDICVLLALLILTPLTSKGSGAGAVRVLRILRLLRALRILRAARVFPQLSLVLETLIRSTASVLYIMAFLMLITYIFAIVGGEQA